MRRVVLASESPRRRQLLRAIVEEFAVAPAGIVEVEGPQPRRTAVSLAVQKASAVRERERGAIVLAADTVVHDGVRSLGKPGDEAEALAMLRSLAGREHVAVTGVAVAAGDTMRAAWSEAKVEVAPLSDAALAAYVASGRPLDKAGAYGIQDEDVPTVSRLEGCYCAVMGLPLWLVRALLAAAGASPQRPDRAFARCATCPDGARFGG